MRASELGKKSLQISYAVFFVLVASSVGLLLLLADRKLHPSLASFAIPFAIAFLWQTFTLYHNRHAFLARILVVLYGVATVVFALSCAH